MRKEALLAMLRKAKSAYRRKSCPFCVLATLRLKRWLKTNDNECLGLYNYCHEHEIKDCCCFCEFSGESVKLSERKREFACVFVGKRLLKQLEKEAEK